MNHTSNRNQRLFQIQLAVFHAAGDVPAAGVPLPAFRRTSTAVVGSGKEYPTEPFDVPSTNLSVIRRL
jgi:hypothetical protein